MLKYREPAIELLELFDPLFRAWQKWQRVYDRATANANANAKKTKKNSVFSVPYQKLEKTE